MKRFKFVESEGFESFNTMICFDLYFLHIYLKIIELSFQIVRLRRGINIFILLNLFLNILSYIVY